MTDLSDLRIAMETATAADEAARMKRDEAQQWLLAAIRNNRLMPDQWEFVRRREYLEAVAAHDASGERRKAAWAAYDASKRDQEVRRQAEEV
ncbi:MAG: hypothetical protein MEQ84_13265 [Mesorhizobium sp.]|nr:hypothetical protein [Mesorhizobium sp.]